MTSIWRKDWWANSWFKWDQAQCGLLLLTIHTNTFIIELLTRTEDIIELWKEHFQDLLKLFTIFEEAESEDEVRPEMKTLDVVLLSWWTRLFSLTWRTTRLLVLIFFLNGGTRECVPTDSDQSGGVIQSLWPVCVLLKRRIRTETTKFNFGTLKINLLKINSTTSLKSKYFQIKWTNLLVQCDKCTSWNIEKFPG